jgi:hypothetical protein
VIISGEEDANRKCDAYGKGQREDPEQGRDRKGRGNDIRDRSIGVFVGRTQVTLDESFEVTEVLADQRVVEVVFRGNVRQYLRRETLFAVEGAPRYHMHEGKGKSSDRP